MLLSEFKKKLQTISEVAFIKPDGNAIPKHFHITEVGQVDKRFIDCGGVTRTEHVISMQLWESVDYWHRLEPNKLLSIIDLSIDKLGIEDHEIEIEYQGDTIGKYGLQFENGTFILTSTKTTCLASDKCGVPSFGKVKESVKSSCSPNSGCC